MDRYRKINELLDKLKARSGVEDGPCPKCDGEYWLISDSAAASQEVIMSLALGIWRGIPFNSEVLSLDGAADMIRSFLSAVHSDGTSSCPAGMAAPGRAIYPKAVQGAKEQGKGENHGEQERKGQDHV